MKLETVFIRVIALIALFSQVSPAKSVELSDITCGTLINGYGPFDYRSDKNELPVVEFHHLTAPVLSLRSGQTGVHPGGDLDYTLRAFPNHPMALIAMVRLGEKTGLKKPKGARYSVECYLYRAWRFRNDDPMVRMIYGAYLAKQGRTKEALAHLEDAREMGEESGNFDYNLGLIYFDLREYDKSLLYAHQAYAKGFGLPGLREKLKKAGKWSDPRDKNETKSGAN